MLKGLVGIARAVIPNNGIFSHLQHFGFPLEPHTVTSLETVLIAAGLAIAFFAPNSQEILGRFRVGLDTPADAPPPRAAIVTLSWPWAIAIGVLLGVTLRLATAPSPFLYFQF